MEDHFAGLENARSENAGLDFEGPSCRSNGIVGSGVYSVAQCNTASLLR